MQHDSRPSGWSPQVSDDDYIRFLRGESVLGLSDPIGSAQSSGGRRRRRREDDPDAPDAPAASATPPPVEPRAGRRRTAEPAAEPSDARSSEPHTNGGRSERNPDPFESYLRQRGTEGHSELDGLILPVRRIDPPPPAPPQFTPPPPPPRFVRPLASPPPPVEYPPAPTSDAPASGGPAFTGPGLGSPPLAGPPPGGPNLTDPAITGPGLGDRPLGSPPFDGLPPTGPTFTPPGLADPQFPDPPPDGLTFTGARFTGSTGPTFTGPSLGDPVSTGPSVGGPMLTGPSLGGPMLTGPVAAGPGLGGPGFTAPGYQFSGYQAPAYPPAVEPPPADPPQTGPPRHRGRHAALDEDSLPLVGWPAPEPWQLAGPAPAVVDATALVAWPDTEATELHPFDPGGPELDETTEQICQEQLAAMQYAAPSAEPASAATAGVSGVPRAARRAAARKPLGKHPRWVRILAWSGAFVGTLALAFGGYAFYEYRKISHNINRVDALATNDPAIKDGAKQLNAENFLLIGSDTRAGANERYGGQVGGQRSDTTILAHLSPDRQHATLVSFPRDAWVSIPECTAPNGQVIPAHDGMFNSAFETGGPNCTVRMMQRLTGIGITHYVQVDFTGFKSMVDALGGIPICSTETVYDRDSGLRLHRGEQMLCGEQALAFVRARHALGDGSDLDRIKRQQMFLGSMMRVATSNRILFNPVALTRFLEAASKSVTLDRQTTLNDLRRLAGQVQGLDPRRVRFLTAPIANRDYDPTGQRATGGGRVLLDAEQGALLWQSMINDKPAAKAAGSRPPANTATVTLPPEQVSVRVLNGVGISGLAGRVATALGGQGFTLTSTANATGSGVTTSVIRYAPANREAAVTLAAAVPGSVLSADPYLDQTLELVLGQSYRGVRPVRLGQQVTLTQTAVTSGGAPMATPSPQPSMNAGDTNICA